MRTQQRSTLHRLHCDWLTRQTKRKLYTCARLSVIHWYRFIGTQCLLSTRGRRQCESLTGLHLVHLSRPRSTYAARSTQKNMHATYRMELRVFFFLEGGSKNCEKVNISFVMSVRRPHGTRLPLDGFP